jgi:hypothetical protein
MTFPHRRYGLECWDVTKPAFVGIAVNSTNIRQNILQVESETTQSKTPRQTDQLSCRRHIEGLKRSMSRSYWTVYAASRYPRNIRPEASLNKGVNRPRKVA